VGYREFDRLVAVRLDVCSMLIAALVGEFAALPSR